MRKNSLNYKTPEPSIERLSPVVVAAVTPFLMLGSFFIGTVALLASDWKWRDAIALMAVPTALVTLAAIVFSVWEWIRNAESRTPAMFAISAGAIVIAIIIFCAIQLP